MDFFVIRTVSFRLLYAWFVIDHVVVLGEAPIRRLLRDYVTYYNADRVHTRPADTPDGRPIEARPSFEARVAGLPRVSVLGKFASSRHRCV